MSNKSQAYWEGFNAEAARTAVKERARAALDAHPNLADIAREVAGHLGRDQAKKQRILQGSPHLAHSLDADELGSMSSRELARYELKQLGINVSDSSDPVEVRDAFHAGRMHERQGAGWQPDRSSAGMDGVSDGTPSFMNTYLNSKE